MTYAVIGAGAIGSAVATQFARSGIDLLVANSRGPASLEPLATRLGPHVIPTTLDDALGAEVVILAVPFRSVPDAVRGAAAWNGRIVVDASNAIDFPAFTPSDLGGRASTELVAEQVPGARVVKAFNTLPAALLARDPREHGGRRVLFVSSTDGDAASTILALVERLGFAGLSLGNPGEGGRLQQFGGALMVHDLSLH